MARFYVGQPVVCVKEPEWWHSNLHRRFVPTKNQKYYVTKTGLGLKPDGEWHPAVGLRGFPIFVAFHEDGFEPITENQVQAIIAIATDVPEEVRNEEFCDEAIREAEDV